MTQCHPDISAASVLNLGESTVRVCSDGVPERDFQKEPARGSMRQKGNYGDAEILGRRPEAERPRGCKAVDMRICLIP